MKKHVLTESHTMAMHHALKLAEEGRWTVAPNPTVGAVLLNKDGLIVASGFHSVFGGDHAEIACLKDAKEKNVNISECSLVVTLEPCNHQGKTAPCTVAIVEAGIQHVVIGMRDPNPLAGGGAEYLEEHGVQVDFGVLEEDCITALDDFTVWTTQQRPYIFLKMGTTLDGKIATRTGQSHYITSDESRLKVAQMRANVGKAKGTILIGSGTFFQDNPQLTARGIECEQQPKASIAITSRLPNADSPSFLVKERAKDAIFFTTHAQAASPNAASLRETGAKVYGLDSSPLGKGLNIKELLKILFETEKCPYILCEGGSKLAYTLFELGCVDGYHQFVAPMLFADNEAKSVINGKDTETLADAYKLKLMGLEKLGSDLHLIYKPLFTKTEG